MKNNQYSLLHKRSTHLVRGATFHFVRVDDIYATMTHAVQRRAVRLFTGMLQWYLSQHPEFTHEHPKNLARKLSYLPSGMRAWKAYMPGGFATYYAQKPTARIMENGAKLDVITRLFFKHTHDAVGLRSRASVLAWNIQQYIQERAEKKIYWLSIAGGSGQPVYDTLGLLTTEQKKQLTIRLLDRNADIIQFAKKIYLSQPERADALDVIHGDIFDKDLYETLFSPVRPNIIDAMGLFEYLEDDIAVELLSRIYAWLSDDGIAIFTNMRRERPQLKTHTTALGWPGVIQRSESEVIALISRAGISPRDVEIFCPQDRVYNIYRIEKKC